MSFLNNTLLSVLLGVLFLSNTGTKHFKASSDVNNGNKAAAYSIKSSGYRAICKSEEGFIAVGSDGRIDRISASGKIIKSEKISGENFNCLLVSKKDAFVGGDKGTILIYSDKGTIRRLKSDTEKNINSLTLFKGAIVAGADEGVILLGNENGSFRRIYLSVNGNIVSVSANGNECFGATDEGEIIHTTDGVNWNIININEVYAGYYKPCAFTSIVVTENRIAVAGVNDDGSSVLMFSSQGNVWTERTLNYSDDNGMQNILTDNDSRDQFYLACNNGKMMSIPSCSHCNRANQITDKNLTGISAIRDNLLIIGEDFYIEEIIPSW